MAARLSEALQQLDQATCGICTGGGGPIRFERLDLISETLTCAR